MPDFTAGQTVRIADLNVLRLVNACADGDGYATLAAAKYHEICAGLAGAGFLEVDPSRAHTYRITDKGRQCFPKHRVGQVIVDAAEAAGAAQDPTTFSQKVAAELPQPPVRVRWEWMDGSNEKGVCTLEAFLADNHADADPEIRERLEALNPWETAIFGGGAAPECRVTILGDSEPTEP